MLRRLRSSALSACFGLASLAALVSFNGCSSSDGPPADGASYWRAPAFPGVAGKRVAILSFDEATAARLPGALSLRPQPPQPGETQKQTEARRRDDFRRIGELFAGVPEADRDRAARSQLYHHAFAKALLERKAELIERERIARLFGEQRLNDEDDPRLTAEQRRERGVDVVPCDYVVVGSPIFDATAWDWSLNLATLPLCILIVPIIPLLVESAALSASEASGLIAVAAPRWHRIEERRTLGLSARMIDVRTGEIVWVGSAWCVIAAEGGITAGAEEGATHGELAALDTIAAALADGVAGKAP